MRRLSLALVAIVLLFAVCTIEEKQGLPNIVVFLVDDMGVMDTSVPF